MPDGVAGRLEGWLRSPCNFRLILAIFGCYGLLAMLFVWLNVAFVRQAYEFHSLKQHNRSLWRESRLLTIERESLRSLPRVQALARSQLDLRPAQNGQVVTVFYR